MIRVGVNGYGTIGKRVADAIDRQPDMTVAGVAKTRPNFEATAATRRGYDLYAAKRDPERFADAGIAVAGPLADLIAASDVIVDATPAGVGAEYRDLYREHDTPAVFQGGEGADVAEASFNARGNFAAAAGADAVRVVSCNTTGLCRLIAPLEERYGVASVGATLVRRGGDPAQPDRGPIDDILPDPVAIPSHHGPDVRRVFPEIDVQTMGVRVPATLMHLHGVRVRLEAAPSEVRSLLGGESRIALVTEDWAIEGCGALREFARDVGRPRGDLWENCVWEESITVQDRELFCFQAIHQESDVVPENVDAVRALTGTADARESMATTDEALGMGLAVDHGRRIAAGAE